MELEYVRNLSGWNGVAKLYRNATTDEYYVVSRANTSDRGDETMIFKSLDSEGDSVDFTDLYAGYGVDHETAVAEFTSGQLF